MYTETVVAYFISVSQQLPRRTEFGLYSNRFRPENKSGPRYRYTNLLSEQQEGRISVTFCIVIQSLYSLACRSLWQRQQTYVRFAANAILSLVKAQHLFNLLSLPSAILRTYLVLKHCISKWLSPRFTDAIFVFLVC